MKPDSAKVKGGRPEAPIDWAKVDEMLQAQCSGEGIAGTLGIHPDTLYRRCQKEQGLSFTEYAAGKKSTGKDLLRMKQFELAMEGDRTMLIFLGKVVLGQRETQGLELAMEGMKEKEMTDEELRNEIERLEKIRAFWQ